MSSANLLRIIDVPTLREVVLQPPRSLPCTHLRRDVIVSLTRLSVVGVTIVGDDLMVVLRLMPCLQELSVRFNEWDKDNEPGMESLVDSLTETVLGDGRVQHTLIPSLTSLGIALVRVRSYTHISFVNL